MAVRAFRSMGTTFALIVAARPTPVLDRALDEAMAEVARLERLLSRFDPGSQLSRLNRAGSIEAGPELLDLVDLALAGRAGTGGRFDPTVHDAVVAAGYDRSFDELAPHQGESARVATAAGGGTVTVDRAEGRIVLAPGVRLDLGGIAKGWTADRVLPMLAPFGAALVNAGGDIAACGREWPVEVEAAGLTLTLGDGGLATTGVDRRHWTRGGRELHHVIDPSTGESVLGDLLTVSVFAESAAAAEVAATALFLAGTAAEAVAEANAAHIPAVLVERGGRIHLTGGIR